jgi:hypothetical protein
MRASGTWISFGSLFLFLACASSPKLPLSSEIRSPAQSQVTAKILTREEVMGPNRAMSSKMKAGRDFIFRNVASAFPDNGKNMLLKDRALSKMSVSGAVDHSPWHLRLYQGPEHIKRDQERFATLNKVFYSTALTEREANLLAQSPKKNIPQPFYQTETLGVDDAYEPNNQAPAAFNLLNAENQWLSFLGTEGVQWDEDWFKVWVSPQYRRLMLDLRFQHYLGDVDMRLYDSAGNLVAVSQGSGEDEFIHLVLERGGIYFVQIFGSNHGNRYDFKYSTYFTGGGDDEYEENDVIKSPFDLRKFEGKWLSEIRGEGVAADDDFYLIQVPKGRERVIVDLRCDVDRGDVDVRLMNSKGQVVASSSNIGDDDYIDFTVAEPGNYYLKVYPFAPQSTFNMYDLKWYTEKTSQVGASKSSSKKPERVPTATQ